MTSLHSRAGGRRLRRLMVASVAVVVGLGVLSPAVVASAGPKLITKADLKNIYIPSACNHKPGKLVNGSLPVADPSGGYVELDYGKSILAKLKPGAKGGAVAVLHCNPGWSVWSDVLAFYDQNGTLIRGFDLSSSSNSSGSVKRVTVSNGNVTVYVGNVVRDDEQTCCGTGNAIVKFRWSASKKTIVKVSTTVHNEEPIAKAFFAAVKKGDARTARKYADAVSANRAITFLRQHPRNARFVGCFGALAPGSSYWGKGGFVVSPSLKFDTDRLCVVQSSVSTRSNMNLWMTRSGLTGWKVHVRADAGS